MTGYDVKCVTCEKTSDEVTLRKCSVCHRYYCDDHAHQRSGRSFCSTHCADYFFFGDEDD